MNEMMRALKSVCCSRLSWIGLFAALLLLIGTLAFPNATSAQTDNQPDQSGTDASKKPQPPPPPRPGASSSKDDSSSSSSSHTDAAPNPEPVDDESDPKWNPFHAQHDLDVGTFYMHKGDYDAAIGRFQDAIALQPKLAKPRYLIAEIYAKKGDKIAAAKYYREYLQVFPDAPDAKAVRKKIEKLTDR
ncbi:MAG: tetratricopeptide repeat protein [Candidatus Acidiferrales bacterium]